MSVKPKADWISIEGEFRAGRRSLREMASDHGITEGAIRKRAKAEGWIRDPAGTKREQVKAIMAGAGTHAGTQYAAETIAAEAQQDADDMGLGLQVARKTLRRLSDMVDQCDTPKDVKIVAEANKIAIDTIRRIRGLDDATGPDVTVKWDGGE